MNTIDFSAEYSFDAELYAKVGLKMDFELDLGSVDTDLDYSLTTKSQYNLTTDMLLITPLMTEMTTGDSVAFSTLSPNATFYAGILYDVGANIEMFIDGSSVVAGTTIFDLSPTSDGISLVENIGIEGEIVLIDFDSTETESVDVPFIETLTGDAVSISLNIPTIETEGTAQDFDLDYFQEGDLLNLDFSEISGAFFNFINAGIDFSPEIKAAFASLGSLEEGGDGFAAVMASVGTVLEGIWDLVSGEADTDGDGVVPIFLLDGTDETSTSLLHLNLVPDDISTIDIDTANFGFYVSYGESEPIVEVTIDIDQFIALVANYAIGNVSGIVINPLVKEYGLSLLLDIAHVDKTTQEQIEQFVYADFVFEYADFDISTGWDFSQEFTLSVDDMAFFVTMEDGAEYIFSANTEGNLLIDNASKHDANGDGSIDYSIQLIPEAMFSNDTEIGMSMSYTLDFIKSTLEAGFQLPIGDWLGLDSLDPIQISLLDLGIGPLLRVQGDLDILDIDLFEDRFQMDIGSADVSGAINAIDDALVGTDGDDELFAFEGNDILAGGLGNDFLSGGSGNDLFVFAEGDGKDTISDFDLNSGDLIDLQLLSNIDSFDDIQGRNDTDGNAILEYGDDDSITLLGVSFDQLDQDSFLV